MDSGLYQKLGVAVDLLAQDLLGKKPGDRIPSVSEYQQLLQVSRGTVQNCLAYLKDTGAVTLVSRGHMGTFVEKLDYRRLQECCFNRELLGSMPLPYSACYQGLATALFQQLSPYAFNLVYARGAERRLKMVTSGLCRFTVCSRYAAEEAQKNRGDVSIAVDLGPGTYLTRHVLVLRAPGEGRVTDGMRVAYDRDSPDQRSITERITAGKKNIRLVEIKAHHTVRAIMNGEVDAGVWNLDEILESGYQGLHIAPLDYVAGIDKFSTAVLVVDRKDENMLRLLQQSICSETVAKIQQDVREGRRTADY